MVILKSSPQSHSSEARLPDRFGIARLVLLLLVLCASPAYADLVVKTGEQVRFEVRERLNVRARGFTNLKGKRRVGLVFIAERRLGNTLYRKGRRIAITWQCVDAEEKVLAEGPMRYG